MPENKKVAKYDKLIEAFTWIIMIIVIFGIRFLPIDLINAEEGYLLIGAIIGFALLYYLVIYRYFSRSKRMYLKDIADIILIGILIHIVKDYGQYFFALYFLPIAAAALSLEFISALLIAAVAALVVVFEIFLGSYTGIATETSKLYAGAWQIGMILFITIFCRFLALQIKEEKSQKEEALAKQKMLEKEAEKEKEFISLTSHQLYTPLSIVRGFASMLDDETLGKLNEKQKEASDEIYKNSKRMANLVSELLSISRIRSGKFNIVLAPTDINKMLSEIAREFNHTKEKSNVEVELDIEHTAQDRNIDADKVRQVVYNLVDNAIKYTEKGKIILASRQNEKATIISVSDEGAGISKADAEKIFEPFFRGKNILELDNRGTGLGLYIARLIIEQHGGQIWFESKNKGTTFSFSLPNK